MPVIEKYSLEIPAISMEKLKYVNSKACWTFAGQPILWFIVWSLRQWMETQSTAWLYEYPTMFEIQDGYTILKWWLALACSLRHLCQFLFYMRAMLLFNLTNGSYFQNQFKKTLASQTVMRIFHHKANSWCKDSTLQYFFYLYFFNDRWELEPVRMPDQAGESFLVLN